MSERSPTLGRKITTAAVGALLALTFHGANATAETNKKAPVTADDLIPMETTTSTPQDSSTSTTLDKGSVTGDVAFLCPVDTNGDGIIDNYVTILVDITPDKPAEDPCALLIQTPQSTTTSEQVAVDDPPVPNGQIKPSLPDTGNSGETAGLAFSITTLGLIATAYARRRPDAA